MSVKFGLNIPNHLGKNVRKPQGDFLTHFVDPQFSVTHTQSADL